MDDTDLGTTGPAGGTSASGSGDMSIISGFPDDVTPSNTGLRGGHVGVMSIDSLTHAEELANDHQETTPRALFAKNVDYWEREAWKSGGPAEPTDVQLVKFAFADRLEVLHREKYMTSHPSDVSADPSLDKEVERQARTERVRRMARRRVDEEDAAALDNAVEVTEDWQPMTTTELHARFESLVGQEWVESIAPKGSKGNVYGPSMSAKTVFLNYIALAGANASPRGTSTVFGKTITEPFGTLFITLEDGHNQHARLDGLAKQHEWTTDGVLVIVPDDAPHVSNPDSLARLITATLVAQKRLREDYGLPLGQVIIDTGKYLVAGKDTNSTESHSLVTALLAKLSRVTDGAYVAVVTHTPLSDDDRPVGSHDQMASRDHGIAIKNVYGTRHVTLAKHKFSECDVTIGQFKVIPVGTPFSPRTMPGLVEHGSAAAGFSAGAAKIAAEAQVKVDVVQELLDFFNTRRDGEGWVDQNLVQSNQTAGGFGKNRAIRAKELLDLIDDSTVEVVVFPDGKATRKRWRIRPDLTAEKVMATVRDGLNVNE